MATTLASLNRKLEKKRNELKALNAKLKRLDEAYKQLSDAKDEQEKLKNRIEKIATDDSTAWQGSNYAYFQQCSNAALSNSQNIYNSLDKILDDLNWARNDVMDEITFIGALIRNIVTQIQNWGN